MIFDISVRHIHIIQSASSFINAEIVARGLLQAVEHGVELVDARAEVAGVAAEGDLEHAQELVHAVDEALRRVGHAVDAGLALVDDHLVRQVGRHDEVVLHDERRLLVVDDEALQHPRADHSLLAVQVGRGLVD